MLEDLNLSSRVVRPSQLASLQTITNAHGSHRRYNDVPELRQDSGTQFEFPSSRFS